MTRFAFLEGEDSRRRSFWIGAAFLLFLTLCMFGDVLFTSQAVVLSSGQNDLASQFIYWRAFATDQLRQGHIPLWNPHVFCGTPFVGWAQAGVFYPPNWFDLLLPLPLSINLGIALHVFLAGLFTFWWALRRRLHPIAAIFSGALFMFCGAYFLHVYAGHLSLLYAIAWTPLVLGCLDQWIQTRANVWLLLGIVAIAMQILAGDMQAVFCTAVAGALLLAIGLIRTQHRLTSFSGFIIMYAGAAALGAVQLLTSFQAVSESVRSDGVTYEFASMISFAPENLLTLVAPGFFGNIVSTPYWGRWYLWEMCLFIGAIGLVLAIYGAIRAGEQRRILVPLVIILLVLALGSNTPLFHLLYRGVPGFNRFRANAKFIMEASLFLALLAGAGLDHLLRNPKNNGRFALGLLLAGVIVGGTAIELRHTALAPGPANWWSRAMRAVYETGETYLPETDYTNPATVSRAGAFASTTLLVAAAELLALAGLVLFTRVSQKAIYAIALLGIAEVFVFGRMSLATFALSSTEAPKLNSFLSQRPGDYRIFYEQAPNVAMWLNKEDVWGYAPLMLKRYAEFMAFTQGQSTEDATQYLDFSRFHPLHAMLRWRYAFLQAEKGDRIVTAPAIMPRFQSIGSYIVIKDRDKILQTMDSPFFNSQQQVILESKPDPAPVSPVQGGSVEVIDSSVNHMTLVVDVPQPAILLITDTYSKGWRARPLEGSVQRTYQVMPANYVLKAIPLSQGHHRIRLEYRPTAFVVGAWISVVSIISFAFVVRYQLRKNRARPGLP